VFASPAVGDGVLVAMGHITPTGTKVFAIQLGGAGKVTQTNRLWEATVRKDCIGSGVVHDGCVFLVTQSGFALCLDLKTGKKVGGAAPRCCGVVVLTGPGGRPAARGRPCGPGVSPGRRPGFRGVAHEHDPGRDDLLVPSHRQWLRAPADPRCSLVLRRRPLSFASGRGRGLCAWCGSRQGLR
jgi:PQQ-like domain